MPFAPRSPKPRIRSPSVITAILTSSSGQLESTSATRPCIAQSQIDKQHSLRMTFKVSTKRQAPDRSLLIQEGGNDGSSASDCTALTWRGCRPGQPFMSTFPAHVDACAGPCSECWAKECKHNSSRQEAWAGNHLSFASACVRRCVRLHAWDEQGGCEGKAGAQKGEGAGARGQLCSVTQGAES